MKMLYFCISLKYPHLYIRMTIQPSYRNVQFLKLLKSLNLPPVRPHWAEFTDAGPGVGANNTEVSFRDAELSRIYQSDYRIRVHRAAGDRMKPNE